MSETLLRLVEKETVDKNKNKALKILRARLFDKIQAEQKAVRDATRAGQIGSGDRGGEPGRTRADDGHVKSFLPGAVATVVHCLSLS